MKGPDRLARAADPLCGCHASTLVIPEALVAAATVDLSISRLSMPSLQTLFRDSIDNALNSDNYRGRNERPTRRRLGQAVLHLWNWVGLRRAHWVPKVVTPTPGITVGLPRTAGVAARWSKSRTPEPRRTAVTSTLISSR